MRTESFGGREKYLVILLEVMNLPPQTRRLQKWLITFIVVITGPVADSLFYITFAAAKRLKTSFDEGYAVRSGQRYQVCFRTPGSLPVRVHRSISNAVCACPPINPSACQPTCYPLPARDS